VQRRDPDKWGKIRMGPGRIVSVEAWLLAEGPDQGPAHIVSWLVEGPFHPVWSQWVIGAVDLREHDGVAPANKGCELVTHEIVICAIHPDDTINPGGKSPKQWRWLTPVDFAFQFAAVPLADAAADALAADVVERMVDVICAGKMSPDSDYRRRWQRWTVRRFSEMLDERAAQ